MPDAQIIYGFIAQYRYLAILPLAFFEGPVFSLFLGFLVSLGYLSFLPTYLILIFGDIVPDAVFYYIGRLGKKADLLRRYGPKLGLNSEKTDLIERLWHHHPKKTMFLAKLAYGLSGAFLVSAGLVHMRPRKYFPHALVVSLIQYTILLTLGTLAGSYYLKLSGYIKYAEIIFAVAAVAFVIFYYRLSKYAGRKLKEAEQAEEKEI